MRESVRGSRPPTEGTSMLSSGRTIEAIAQPYLRLIFSASFGAVRSPTEMSLVTWLPPRAMTDVCQMLPWWKTAMSVVPPPMSISATPRFFSSSVSAAYEEASCCSTRSRTSSPARLQLLMMFWAEVTAPVTMCTSASMRTPDMPSGFLMPSCSSITNCWGSTCSTSRSIGIATALAASITRSMSPCVTSLSLIAMTPRELNPLMWLPAMPAMTASISHPGHQLGLLDGLLDRLDGRVDVGDDALAHPARGARADADDVQALVGDLPDDRQDLGRPDVQADHAVFVFRHVRPPP